MKDKRLGADALAAVVAIVVRRTRKLRNRRLHLPGAPCGLRASALLGPRAGLESVNCEDCPSLVMATAVRLLSEFKRKAKRGGDLAATVTRLADERFRDEMNRLDGERGFTQKPQRLVQNRSVVALFPDPVCRHILGEMLVFCRNAWPAQEPWGWPLESWLGSLDPDLDGPATKHELATHVNRIIGVLESPQGRRAFRDVSFFERNIGNPFARKLAALHAPLLARARSNPSPEFGSDDEAPSEARQLPSQWQRVVGAVEAARADLLSRKTSAVRRSAVEHALVRHVGRLGYVDLGAVRQHPNWAAATEQLYREVKGGWELTA